MKCPKCDSENTQRLQVVFQNGTQNISTTSRSTGIGIGSNGSLAMGLGSSKTSGQAQSILAQQVAPPPKKSLKWPVIGGIVGLLVLFIGTVVHFLMGIAILGLSGYFIYQRSLFNSKEWPALYQHWSNSWICNKCGDVYHQA